MKVRRVNRYYCDFCKKSGCAAGHMKKHEKHCTLNPDRVCRMCQALEQPQPDLQPAIELLPNSRDFKTDYSDHYGTWTRYDKLPAALAAAMPGVRDLTSGCPVCLFSAIRRRGLMANGQLVQIVKEAGFDFKKELESTWGDINSERECAY